MIEVPIVSIPADCFVMSWYHLKLIAGGSFSLGFILSSVIQYIKNHKTATEEQ